MTTEHEDVAPTLVALARLDLPAFRRKVADRLRPHRPRIADALENRSTIALAWVVDLAHASELDDLTTAYVHALAAAEELP